ENIFEKFKGDDRKEVNKRSYSQEYRFFLIFKEVNCEMTVKSLIWEHVGHDMMTFKILTEKIYQNIYFLRCFKLRELIFQNSLQVALAYDFVKICTLGSTITTTKIYCLHSRLTPESRQIFCMMTSKFYGNLCDVHLYCRIDYFR
ncbi:Hypothetical predicted protein, partial [Mytilus galloprovincialis]